MSSCDRARVMALHQPSQTYAFWVISYAGNEAISSSVTMKTTSRKGIVFRPDVEYHAQQTGNKHIFTYPEKSTNNN